MNRLIIYSLILLSVLWGFAYGQHKPPAQPEKTISANNLELPSFSIFGISPSTFPREVDKPFSPGELERFLSLIQKYKAEDKGFERKSQYWMIPMVFYRSRHLFSKEVWTAEEISQGQQISDFFARLTDRPDLKIEALDQQSFRRGLINLRDWFASMCKDNKTLASMIFTVDDGPFLGGDIDVSNFPKMKLIESSPVLGKQASFVLMSDGSQPEPMIIGVLNDDKSVRWLKRFSNSPHGRITSAWILNPAIYVVESYGYVVALMTRGSAGTEHSKVYLDESLNLRFYYVSW